MLVLSRKQQESVVINNNVTVTVLSIHGGNVRLGFEAPREMPVHRWELHEAMKQGQATRDAGTENDVPAIK